MTASEQRIAQEVAELSAKLSGTLVGSRIPIAMLALATTLAKELRDGDHPDDRLREALSRFIRVGVECCADIQQVRNN
jgi:hypothetical protein